MVLSTFRNSYFRTSDEYRQRSKKFFEVIGNFENRSLRPEKHIFTLPTPLQERSFSVSRNTPIIYSSRNLAAFISAHFVSIFSFNFSFPTSFLFLPFYMFLLILFPFFIFSPRINTANVPVPWGGGVYLQYTRCTPDGNSKFSCES